DESDGTTEQSAGCYPSLSIPSPGEILVYNSLAFQRPLLAACCLLLLAATINADVPAKSALQDSEEKVGKLLNESGYNFRKTGKASWLIDYVSKDGRKSQVLLATGPDFMVAGVIVAFKRNLPANADLLHRLLKFNHSLDFAKVGLDDDDDLFVRSETSTTYLDLARLKAEVERVTADADKIYATIKPDLVN